MSSNAPSTAGPGFFTLLSILFIGLKLTGFIDWPWLWVLSPLWIPFLAFIAFAILALIAYAIFHRN